MTPVKGQVVELFLRYNIQVQGVVKEWSDDQIVLVSGSDHFIAYNPREDLILAKIVGRSRLGTIVREPIENAMEAIDTPIVEDYLPETVAEDIKEDIAETIASPSGNSLRLKKLGQLRTMLASAEKDIVANKLTTHQMQPEIEVQYANPAVLFRRK